MFEKPVHYKWTCLIFNPYLICAFPGSQHHGTKPINVYLFHELWLLPRFSNQGGQLLANFRHYCKVLSNGWWPSILQSRLPMVEDNMDLILRYFTDTHYTHSNNEQLSLIAISDNIKLKDMSPPTHTHNVSFSALFPCLLCIYVCFLFQHLMFLEYNWNILWLIFIVMKF